MTVFVCIACGTLYPDDDVPPPACPICRDERQFVPPGGQEWTTREKLAARHKPTFAAEGELLGIGIAPDFAIGQRTLLVRTPAGNVLWDCVPLLTPATVDLIGGIGGLAAIAISHPHYYSAMADWAEAFDCPVLLHAADREWVMRPSRRIEFWEGERRPLLPGLTLVRCGGHFAGGTVLHVDAAARRKPALLVGDILQVTPGCDRLGFMRSYPNYLPLGPRAVEAVAAALHGLDFEAIYGAFWGRVVPEGGRAVLEASVARHVAWASDRAAEI
ncbi:MBL fold metallo-hydrolase [Aureimonas leprariae]|uniref:MBL fold metallo-hydrolase n=1 Tax=Plantimonas leprariae TaxID=2615207 RepID=A0A7V7PNL3_9HYPH|nr:MBL fold metallo-hydrolase [Aureimonas leprariae]KAB0679365.1 MBL fold metallo-hydrolase [Aureimonas leprariae]